MSIERNKNVQDVVRAIDLWQNRSSALLAFHALEVHHRVDRTSTIPFQVALPLITAFS